MKLSLVVNETKVYVTCKIKIRKDTYSFALASTLELTKIENNHRVMTEEHTEDCKMNFQPAMKKHTITNLKPGLLKLSYEGTLEGYFLYLQEEIYHFSFYNGWYPIGFDVEEEYEIKVDCDPVYEMINAQYDNENQLWRYSTKGQSLVDCNVLLIHKEKSIHYQSPAVDIYYFEEEYKASMTKLFEQYTAIHDFYTDLYGSDKLEHTNIVLLPGHRNNGAYKRDHLIVFATLESNPQNTIHTLAHEMGHAYAVGADVNSWEDWLNETHAEWSALLYELKQNPEYFELLMKKKYAGYQHESMSLRPYGDARPEEVHETGTLLYDKIYRAYGVTAIRTLLTTFDSLTVKNTENFIAALRPEHQVLSEMIEKECNEREM